MNQSWTNHEDFMKLHEQFIKVLEVMNSTSQGMCNNDDVQIESDKDEKKKLPNISDQRD